MFDDDFDDYEPTEEDLKNPHLKEFIIKDDETAQRLIDAMEAPPAISIKEVRERMKESGAHIATHEDINRLFLAIKDKGEGNDEGHY